MRSVLSAVLLLVLTAGLVQAQQPPSGPPEFVCPVDGHKFKLAQVTPGDGRGGMDSDMCQHNRTGLPYPNVVIVCPRCNYARAPRVFAAKLSDTDRGLILRRLAKSPYRGVKNPFTDIPPWACHRLAAQSANVLKETDGELEAWLVGSWCARIEACRVATFKYSASHALSNMMQLRRLIREMEAALVTTKDAAEKKTLLLHLAMMHQRAGSPKARDATIAKLKTTLAGDRLAAARLARFQKLLAIEAEFQREYLAALKRVSAGKDYEPNAVHAFFRAEVLRRLGKPDEALKEYREARKLTTGAGELRARIDYFLTLLAPGEPLVEPEKPERPKAPAPEPEPTEP